MKDREIKYEDRVVSFPQMGNYGIAIKHMASLFGGKVVLPPPITKRTIELGAKYSPEGVCVPFKYNLGNYLEIAEKGANFLLQAGAGCRYGYYGEVQKKILSDLGHDVEFVTMNRVFNLKGVYQKVKASNPKQSYVSISKAIAITLMKFEAIDKIEDICRKNIGFEVKKEEIGNLFKKFLIDLDSVNTFSGIWSVRNKYIKKIREVPIQKPMKPLRVGVVGEVYVLMEPFSNFYLEKLLGQMGVEMHRHVNITHVFWEAVFWKKFIKKELKSAYPYLKYELGAHGTTSVADSHDLMKKGFDGIIHIKPFGCMPEINAMPMLSRASQDYHCPVLFFSFDSQTSENGVKTRLEAFYDMMVFKRKKDMAL